MGQTLIGIISSQLTPVEIVSISERLNKDKPLGIQEENWRWVIEDISVDFLQEYWSRDEQWYINEVTNKRFDRIYKYPSIETNSGWGINFFEPNLIWIDLPLKYSSLVFADPRTDIINMAKRLAKYFKQNTMVLTHDLGSGNTQEELKGVKFKTMSNMINSFRRVNRDFHEINF